MSGTVGYIFEYAGQLERTVMKVALYGRVDDKVQSFTVMARCIVEYAEKDRGDSRYIEFEAYTPYICIF